MIDVLSKSNMCDFSSSPFSQSCNTYRNPGLIRSTIGSSSFQNLANLEEEDAEFLPLKGFFDEDNCKILTEYNQRLHEPPSPLAPQPQYIKITEQHKAYISSIPCSFYFYCTDPGYLLKQKIMNKLFFENITKTTIQETKTNTEKFLRDYFTSMTSRTQVFQMIWATSSDPSPLLYSHYNQGLQFKIMHYIGFGLPPPTETAFFLFPSTCEMSALSIKTLRQSFGPPNLLIFDTNNADILRNEIESTMKSCRQDPNLLSRAYAFFSCSSDQVIKFPPDLPQNLFSTILVSPAKAVSMIYKVDNIDESTFNVVFNLVINGIIQDCIGEENHQVFREQEPIATLWRRYMLAQHILMRFGINCSSIPSIGGFDDHYLWNVLDVAIRSKCLISTVADMYMKQFSNGITQLPSSISIVSSLIHRENYKEMAYSSVSKFMIQSPKNCLMVRNAINIKNLDHLRDIISLPVLYDWCVIISGLLLVDPQFSSKIPEVLSAEMLINYVSSKAHPMSIRVYACSILACMYLNHLDVPPSPEFNKIFENMLSLLWDKTTTSELRTWIVQLLYSMSESTKQVPSEREPKGIYAYCALLLNDDNQYVRTSAILLLSCLLYQRCNTFNQHLLSIAVKSSFDGSEVVRGAYNYFVSVFSQCTDQSAQTSQLTIDDFIRPDITTYDLPLDFSIPKPELPQGSSQITSQQIVYQCHAQLFTRAKTAPISIPKYQDSLFSERKVMKIESFKSDTQVSAIAFDRSSCSLIIGSPDGTVQWSENTYTTSKPVIKIHQFDTDVLISLCKGNQCSVISRNYSTVITSFNPHSDMTLSVADITSVFDSPTVFFATNKPDIVEWNMNSLLPIQCITHELPIRRIYQSDCNSLYIADDSGFVHLYDLRSGSIVQTSTCLRNEVITELGCHSGMIYASALGGPCVFWETLDSCSHAIPKWNQNISFIFHNTLNYAMTNDGIYTDTLEPIASFEDSPFHCFDHTHPIAAYVTSDNVINTLMF